MECRKSDFSYKYEWLFYSSVLNSKDSLGNNIGIPDIGKEPIKQEIVEKFSNSEKNSAVSTIKFAWESSSDEKQNTQIEYAKKAIENSSDIVVIGYTFPLYNRLIDISFFNKEALMGKKILIQDPNADVISDSVKSSFALELHSAIHTHKDCSSFFVPPNIFSPEYFDKKYANYNIL